MPAFDEILRHYGLSSRPFVHVSDPGRAWNGRRNSVLRQELGKAILGRRLAILLLGEDGVGKTTLLRQLQGDLEGQAEAVFLTIGEGEQNLLRRLARALREKQKIAGASLLVIMLDEAQRLSQRDLLGILALADPQRLGSDRLQLLFAGRPTLDNALSAALFQLERRPVIWRERLERLNEAEAVDFIRFRLDNAGAQRAVFTPEALSRIAHHSGGSPRLIEILGANALFFGYPKEVIEAEDIDRLARGEEEGEQLMLVEAEAAPPPGSWRRPLAVGASALAVLIALGAGALLLRDPPGGVVVVPQQAALPPPEAAPVTPSAAPEAAAPPPPVPEIETQAAGDLDQAELQAIIDAARRALAREQFQLAQALIAEGRALAPDSREISALAGLLNELRNPHGQNQAEAPPEEEARPQSLLPQPQSFQSGPTSLLGAPISEAEARPAQSSRPLGLVALEDLGSLRYEISKGGDANTIFENGRSALTIAAERNRPEMVRLLLSRGADPNAVTPSQALPLVYAAWNGDLPSAESLLRAGARPNAGDARGVTALMGAAASNHADVVNALLRFGADPNLQAANGWTALMYAAMADAAEAGATLLRYRADPGLVNDTGETALDVARTQQANAILELLQGGQIAEQP